MNSKKIKTKKQAHEILIELIEYLDVMINLSTKHERSFLVFAQQQLYRMRNSIDQDSNEFFDDIFLNKTKEEVIEWIEDEAKKW